MRMRSLKLTLLILCLGASVALPQFHLLHAEVRQGGVSQDIRSENSKRWTIRPWLQQGALNLAVRNPAEPLKPVRYQPNITSVLGLTVTYGSYSLGYGTSIGLTDDRIRRRGKTEYSNYQFQYTKEGFGVDFFLQDFKGFYVIDKIEPGIIINTITNLDNKVYEQRPDMAESGFGINGFYIFSKESFSYDQVFNQTSLPEKSAGSWVAMGSYSQFKVSNPGPILPANRQSDFSSYASMTGFKLKALSALGGYGYVYVYNKYYLGGFLLAGAGLAEQEFLGVDREASLALALRGYGRFSGGVNTKDIFYGFIVSYDHTGVQNSDLALAPATYLLEIHAGHRF